VKIDRDLEVRAHRRRLRRELLAICVLVQNVEAVTGRRREELRACAALGLDFPVLKGRCGGERMVEAKYLLGIVDALEQYDREAERLREAKRARRSSSRSLARGSPAR
jgi:hypothetical protein